MDWINPVVISVLVMVVLCLLRMNVILALIIAGLVAGLSAGMGFGESIQHLISGMGDNAETALSYILLGALAVSIERTGAAKLLARGVAGLVGDHRSALLLALMLMACASQNLIPVHIAFIPIIVPPLLEVMNRMQLDRRAVATSLTFGLKTPYITLPVGFGLIFHNLIREQMTANGITIATSQVAQAMWLPGLGMVAGLLFALLVSYRKKRIYQDVELPGTKIQEDAGFHARHGWTLAAAVAAFGIQLATDSLVLGAISGLLIMFFSKAVSWQELNDSIEGGIGVMGFIAIVMLVAAGYGNIIRESGGVEKLVEFIASGMGEQKVVAAFLMLVVGLLVTMGIGTSFGTIPILASIFCPLGLELGFSTLGIIALLGTAGALGDAGSPASDSTLGPTSGLNMDGQHDHIWDTCVPTFLHFNIPLIIFGVLAALFL
ncbi:Na+/H+ antiporter family protein [Persicobacter diffluens]|uniref:Sodium:proton antiporter n=1 Tax=Persicobacter diffluens TaxID=981 RepID=A0AAN4W0A2_9BACT|nr:sodium:proton antiporter [Persicobacter diffluens]